MDHAARCARGPAAGRWTALVGALEGLRMESVAAEIGRGPEAVRPRAARAHRDPRPRRGRLADAGGREQPRRRHATTSAWPAARWWRSSPAALVDDLAKGMGELRAKRLLEVSTYEVEGFDVETRDGKKTYTRSTVKDAQGTDVPQVEAHRAGRGQDLDTNKVQDALFAVGGIEATEFIDAAQPPAAYGLDAPALRVTLRMAGGKPPLWFEVGTEGRGVLRPAGRRRRRDEARCREGVGPHHGVFLALATGWAWRPASAWPGAPSASRDRRPRARRRRPRPSPSGS